MDAALWCYILVDGWNWITLIDHQICKDTPNKLFNVPDICKKNDRHQVIIGGGAGPVCAVGLRARIFEILSNGIKWSPLASLTSLKEVKI